VFAALFTVVVLVAGWTADHMYLNARYSAMSEQARLTAAVAQLERATAAARRASTQVEYEEAWSDAAEFMYGYDGSIFMAAYMDAITIPDFDSADMSLSADGSVALGPNVK